MRWFRSSNHHHIGIRLILWVDEMFLFFIKSCAAAVAVISANVDHSLRTFGAPEEPGSPDDWLRTEDEHNYHAN